MAKREDKVKAAMQNKLPLERTLKILEQEKNFLSLHGHYQQATDLNQIKLAIAARSLLNTDCSAPLANSKILSKAIIEEEARRKQSYNELEKLEIIIKNLKLSSGHPYANKLLTLVKDDAATITQFNQVINDYSPQFPLKTNKLSEIFHCTSTLIQKDYNAAIAGNLLINYPIDVNTKTILEGTKDQNGQITNYLGTSMPNCIQNTYFTILRATNTIKHFTDIKSFSIYNVETSPNVQTTQLPDNFDSTSYKNWFYYYQDSKSPIQGELLIPNLGYAFGGSRSDVRYLNKEFREEDCSSAMAKWAGSNTPFSTIHMKNFYNNDTNCEKDTYCKAVGEVFDAVKIDIAATYRGLVFCFPGHTGVVANNFPAEHILETISYARSMPHIEGLGYKNYSYTEKDFIFFEEKCTSHDTNINCDT